MYIKSLITGTVLVLALINIHYGDHCDNLVNSVRDRGYHEYDKKSIQMH